MKRRVIERIISGVEYLISLVFINSGIQLFFLPDIVGNGPLFILGHHIALIIYALWFIFWALVLVYTKIFKKRKWHSRTLLILYLTALYTAMLTIAIVGWVDAIDDIFVALILAACWLRWKFKTEYLSPNYFRKSTEVLRTDLPPRT